MFFGVDNLHVVFRYHPLHEVCFVENGARREGEVGKVACVPLAESVEAIDPLVVCSLPHDGLDDVPRRAPSTKKGYLLSLTKKTYAQPG